MVLVEIMASIYDCHYAGIPVFVLCGYWRDALEKVCFMHNVEDALRFDIGWFSRFVGRSSWV